MMMHSNNPKDTKVLTEKVSSLFEEKGVMVTKQRLSVINMICRRDLITDLDSEWIKLRTESTVSWATMRVTVRLMQKLGLLISEKSDNMKRQFRLNIDFIEKPRVANNS